MEIVKVIVKGELPTGCNKCSLADEEMYRCSADNYEHDRQIVEDWDAMIVKFIDYRPDWCPLISAIYAAIITSDSDAVELFIENTQP